jgi:hypothetical protein
LKFKEVKVNLTTMGWLTRKIIYHMALVEPSEQIKLDLSMASSKMEKDMGLID